MSYFSISTCLLKLSMAAVDYLASVSPAKILEILTLFLLPQSSSWTNILNWACTLFSTKSDVAFLLREVEFMSLWQGQKQVEFSHSNRAAPNTGTTVACSQDKLYFPALRSEVGSALHTSYLSPVSEDDCIKVAWGECLPVSLSRHEESQKQFTTVSVILCNLSFTQVNKVMPI